jgi:hypothetical protein
MTRSIEALEARVHQLETSNRRKTVIGIVALGAWFLIAATGAQVQDEIRAKRLVVVDDAGTARVVIGEDPPGTQRRSRSCGITIHDKTGAERFGVGVMEDNTVNMGFDAAAGVGHAMRDRLALGVAPNGAPYVMLINNETKVPVRLVADGDASSGGGIEFLDYDRPNSKVIIRRISFGEDRKTEVPHKFTD